MYDPIKMQVKYKDKADRTRTIQLTRTENLLLYLLWKHKNKIVTFEKLSEYMLDSKLDYDNYKIVVTAKSRLARKLKNKVIIATYNKQGYMLTKLGEDNG